MGSSTAGRASRPDLHCGRSPGGDGLVFSDGVSRAKDGAGRRYRLVFEVCRTGGGRRDAQHVTRELKLALIVGFLLVLVVTILISDHLSKARTSRLATDLDPRSSLVGATTPITAEELAGGRPPANILEAARVADAGLPPTGPIVAPAAPQAAAPSGVASTNPPVTRIADESQPAPVEFVQGRASDGRPDGVRTAKSSSLGDAIDSLTTQLRVGLPEAARTDGSGAQPQFPQAIQPQEPRIILPVGPVPAAQADRWHVVKEGETAYEITKKYYGDGNLWKKLQEANGDRIAKNGSVRIGVRIKLPPAEAVSGAASSGRARMIPTDPTRVTLAPSTVRPAPAGVPAAPVAASKVRTYTVVSGDTLIGISRKTLGSGKRADEIAKLNKAKLRDRDTVVIGMTLQIPEK